MTSVVYREQQWNACVGERLTPGDYYLVFDNRYSEEGAWRAGFYPLGGEVVTAPVEIGGERCQRPTRDKNDTLFPTHPSALSCSFAPQD